MISPVTTADGKGKGAMDSSGKPRCAKTVLLTIMLMLLSHAANFCAAQDQTLTLREAIETALKRNPGLLGAQSELRATEWDVKRSYFDLLPKVDVEFGYSRMDYQTVRRANIFVPVGQELVRQFAPEEDPNNIRPNAWRNNFGTRINVVQPIYNGGADWAGVSLAQAGRNQKSHSLEEREQDIIFRVHEAYFNVLQAQEMVALMEETVQSSQEHLKTTRKMMELGLRSKADELRWDVQLANDEGNLVTAENQLAIAEVALKNIMGVEYSRTYKLQPVDLEPTDTEQSLTALIDKAMDYHPGLQAMGSAVDMQKADVRMAWAGFQPKINFVYSYGWERNNTLALDSFEDWSASVSVDVPIFHSLSDYASLKRSKAQLQNVQQAREDYQRAVTMQLTTAYLNVKSALKKVHIADKAVAQAEENLRIIENKYGVGMASNVEVIDVQVAFTGARANAINALYDFYIARAELEKSAGIIGTSVSG